MQKPFGISERLLSLNQSYSVLISTFNIIFRYMHKVHHNIPSKKKLFFSVNDDLRKYLLKYGREITLPLQYSDMLRFNLEVPLMDKNGKDTLWKTVYYDEMNMRELYTALTY